MDDPHSSRCRVSPELYLRQFPGPKKYMNTRQAPSIRRSKIELKHPRELLGEWEESLLLRAIISLMGS